MNEQVILIAIGVVVAAFVLRPLWRNRERTAVTRQPSAAPSTGGPSDELAELELDHAMGRVSDEDYQKWRAEAGNAPVIDIPMDNEEAQARAEALVRQWREKERPICSRCGERPEPAARFCSSCGASLVLTPTPDSGP
jgi:cytochrome c-type biogenesis protein CcmI